MPGMGKAARIAGCLSLLLVQLMLLTGCDGPDETTRTSDGRQTIASPSVPVADEGVSTPVRLNWMGHWKGEDKREDLVREVKREYEFLHPEVKINLVFNKDIEGPETGYKQRTAGVIARMIETGIIGWDVIFLDVAVYGQVSELLGDPFWVREHVVDFSRVPGFLDSQKDFIVSDPRYRNKLGGVLTGPFIENYLMNLWYNREVAGEVGLEVRERDMTMEDLYGYAEELHRYNQKHGTSITLMKLSSWNRLDYLFENLFKSLFDDFQSAVEPKLSEEKERAFLESLLAFEKLAQFQPVLNERWRDLSSNDYKRDFLLDDDALFYVGGSFMYSQFRGLDPEKSRSMRPVENPILRKHQGLIGDFSPTFAVMKKSANRERAIEFVMTWAQPKIAEKWVRYTKNLTGIKGNLSQAITEDADVYEDVYEEFIMDMEKKYKGVPMMYLRAPTYVFGEKNPVPATELREKLAQILEGRLRARDYYRDVMARVATAIQ